MTMQQLSPRPVLQYHYHPFLAGSRGMGDTAAADAESALQGAARGFAQGGPVGAAIGVVTGLISSLFTTSLSGRQKITTTEIANDAEVLMQQNLNAYLESPRTHSDQLAAIKNFDDLWNWLVQNCATPSLADAGVACVDDRQRGACKWHKANGAWTQDSSGVWNWTPAGSVGSGDCWNWFTGYRDPISKDPGVVPDALSTSVMPGTGGTVMSDGTPVSATPVDGTMYSSSTSLSISPVLLLAGGLLAVALILPSGGGQ